jgi:hypothetical protein
MGDSGGVGGRVSAVTPKLADAASLRPLAETLPPSPPESPIQQSAASVKSRRRRGWTWYVLSWPIFGPNSAASRTVKRNGGPVCWITPKIAKGMNTSCELAPNLAGELDLKRLADEIGSCVLPRFTTHKQVSMIRLRERR